MIYEGHRDQKYGPTTYSHCGEDLMVVNLFELMGIEFPSYIDVGAHHPFTISNTALLHQRGSRGVNIEANPNMIEAFKVHRPMDVNLNIGIGVEAGEHDFYMWDDRSGRNTFSQEWSKKFHKHEKTIKLPVQTLNHIIEEHCHGMFPDFMSMDIEGLDLAVLQTVDFSVSKPKVICVESDKDDASKIRHLLESKGFFLYSRHAIDQIYVRRDFKELVY